MLDALRILNVVIWTSLFLYMLPSAWSILRGAGVRRSDPMRLSVAAVSLVIILGNLRFLLFPDNQDLFRAIYLLTAAVGVYKIGLARVYGRGPEL